jgi:chemotaxis signal transduction protein
MRTVVHFRTSGGRYCVAVEATLGVRRASELVPLPAPRPGVLGILPAENPITVLSVLGAGQGYVLVLASGEHTFGLMVDEVTGLSRLNDAEIGNAPDGQDETFISGVISRDDGVILVADPAALAGRL